MIIDFLTLTSKVHSYSYLIDLLGLSGAEFLQMSNGRHGWDTWLYYRGVSVFYGGRDDICIDLSGTGCRTVEESSGDTFDWFGFFRVFEHEIHSREVNISRLDIAGDDHDGLLVYNKMVSHVRHSRYICKSRRKIYIGGDEEEILFGAKSSARRLRIYNKALEQGRPEKPWMRCEMQMRDENAVSFLLNWFALGSVGSCYAGVLLDYLRFTKKSVEHSNYSRADICPWWLKFIGEAEKCSQLYLDGGVYELPDVIRFLEHQAGSSLKLWLSANGGDFTDIIAMVDRAQLNRRQKQLLDRLQREI